MNYLTEFNLYIDIVSIMYTVKLARAREYTDCISVEG